MGVIVDAKGLSCPQPVILTVKEMDRLQKGEIEILVDTDTSKENVSRAATAKGWTLKNIEEDESGFRIIISKD